MLGCGRGRPQPWALRTRRRRLQAWWQVGHGAAQPPAPPSPPRRRASRPAALPCARACLLRCPPAQLHELSTAPLRPGATRPALPRRPHRSHAQASRRARRCHPPCPAGPTFHGLSLARWFSLIHTGLRTRACPTTRRHRAAREPGPGRPGRPPGGRHLRRRLGRGAALCRPGRTPPRHDRLLLAAHPALAAAGEAGRRRLPGRRRAACRRGTAPRGRTSVLLGVCPGRQARGKTQPPGRP